MASDWINLGISVLFVLLGYLVGTLLIVRVLPQVVGRTQLSLGQELLQAAGPTVRWLVVLVALHFATIRLVFLSADLKAVLRDVYFVLALVLGFRLVWRLIDLALAWYREHVVLEESRDDLEPVIVLLSRIARAILVVSALIILLSHFGINVTALTASLGVAGLAISLAAQDTLADAISGFIILVDRPYRVGDRIEIQGVETWGDVVDIGIRTTRIRTRDNRMVIVPNSTIGKNQVINYTYPDPLYRIQTHVGIGYGTDIEKVRCLIVDTVRQVEGVLEDRPVDALYNEMGASAMIFRVRWWIESYSDTRQMYDEVHSALQEALEAAGIDMPFPTRTLNLHFDGDPAEWLSQASEGSGQALQAGTSSE